MKKVKLALLVTAGLLASSAHASGWQGNWLLGVSGGWAWNSHDNDATVSLVTTTPPLVFDSFSFDNDNHKTHGVWGLLAGYQARCNGWLLGAEVNVDWRTNDNDQDFTFDSANFGPVVGSFSRDHDAVVGLTGRMGYEVSCWFMPYLRLGVDFGGRNRDVTVSTTGLLDNFTVTGSGDNNNQWGFVGGVGAEFPVPMIAGLSLRAEWNYHGRDNRGSDDNTVLAFNNGAGVAGLVGISGGNDRHEQTARASLVFNFPG